MGRRAVARKVAKKTAHRAAENEFLVQLMLLKHSELTRAFVAKHYQSIAKLLIRLGDAIEEREDRDGTKSTIA